MRWDILEEKDGKALIITHDIIDSMAFDDNGSNNYEESSIRNWLNNDFYDISFNTNEKNLIQLTLVDNSLESTGDNINKYVCNDTEDNIFLLSKKETQTYYMSNDERQAKGTKYAKNQGLYVAILINYEKCFWWLRTPDFYYPNKACLVNAYGDIYEGNADRTNRGVRPACWIKL